MTPCQALYRAKTAAPATAEMVTAARALTWPFILRVAAPLKAVLLKEAAAAPVVEPVPDPVALLVTAPVALDAGPVTVVPNAEVESVEWGVTDTPDETAVPVAVPDPVTLTDEAVVDGFDATLKDPVVS